MMMMNGGRRDLGGVHVLLQLLHVPLEFGTPILKPRDHLGVGQTQRLGDFVPVRWRQVLLVKETLLQLEDLMIGERRPRFPLFLRLLPRAEDVQMVTRGV